MLALEMPSSLFPFRVELPGAEGCNTGHSHSEKDY